MSKRAPRWFIALCLLLIAPAAFAADAPKPVHALAMHGAPKYGPDFTHFDYVNPDAPKSGAVKLPAIGDTFDTLNGFVLKGTAPEGMGLMYDTLLVHSQDEAFTEYGLVAETLEVPKDRSWVIFNLRKEARFHDGKPMTAEDVKFTFDVLTTKGHPVYKFYYGSVDKVEVLGDRRVKFSFKPGDNRELPLILGQLPVLPKHYWAGKDFAASTMEVPLGSGPYKLSKFESGRFAAYERVKDYWAKDLAVTKGLYNFDTIQYDYYRDSTIALEAFKAGEYDLRDENTSKLWATAYDTPALKSGKMIKTEFPHQRGTGMQSWAFNIRRDKFKDPRVRQAIGFAFDFEWSNENLFYGQYRRTESFFSNSELASSGLPSPEELKILEPLRGKIPEDVFTTEYKAPTTTGPRGLRGNLRQAMALLKDAGYGVTDGKLTHLQNGGTLDFEILLLSPAFERIALPFAQNLKKLGIAVRVRTVDTAQYKERLDAFDFDVVVGSWGQSLSPGNEQRNFWGTAAADTKGGRNLIGIKDPVIDDLIEQIIAAPDRKQLVFRTRALDRVLLWHHFVIPQWHIPYSRVAYWDKFGMPETVPLQGYQFMAWWIDPAKATKLK